MSRETASPRPGGAGCHRPRGQHGPPAGSAPTLAAETGASAEVRRSLAGRHLAGDSTDRALLQTDSGPRPAPDPDAQPERRGRDLVLERIGAGGMGVVYAAFDPELERKVAIELIRGRRGRRARLREAQAKLSHPGVVAVHGVGAYQSQLFVAMAFARGVTLGAPMRHRRRTWREILAVLQAAGRGLAAAHDAGLVRRDSKPDHVLLDVDGRVQVTDFGLARAAGTREPEPAAPSYHVGSNMSKRTCRTGHARAGMSCSPIRSRLRLTRTSRRTPARPGGRPPDPGTARPGCSRRRSGTRRTRRAAAGP
ncbi:Protein kinase domain-containing protein [Nannocystis exedens]|uniref:Protein kinase domain-containing protein n=1 Tax=Nannocystis exedens TaxID=54 RepID=A0A1I1T1Q9_9BACT|nr:protein kinase [Nannocystis exedens]SFD52607.1 Protein kinase domain-containing protein [Nannocystis exedens]